MRVRVAGVVGRSRARAQAAGVKSRGQRGMNASALIESHKELLESLTPSQYAKLEAAFLSHGTTQAGFITAKELGPLLKAIGDNPRPAELRELIALVDADGNALIDFQEFLVLVAIRSQHKHTPEEVLEAFRLFDPEGTGAIKVSVFRSAMSHLAGITDAELDELVAEASEVSKQEAARRRELDAAKAMRREAKRKATKLQRSAADESVAELLHITAPSPAAVAISSAYADSTAPESPAVQIPPELLGIRPPGMPVTPARPDHAGMGDMTKDDPVARLFAAPAAVVPSSSPIESPGTSVAAANMGGRKSSIRSPKVIKDEEAEELIYYEVFVRTLFSY